ncbi:response regulator [Sphingomonas sp. BGYR3]|uniref:response regulator n=1 Tax=Sphingomonas sp. BGYR3 TaxID=2975483 RepID=UPI0021A6C364|nr:response regulator [Sphingomonas sp. BGYR3]
MTKSVVIVEDNELNLKLFTDVLRAHGFVVDPVSDGRDAIERLKAVIPDLMVTDMRLGTVNGLDLIAEVKRDLVLRHIPVLALTAYSGPDEEDRAREAGASGYLSKPVSMMRFIEEVRALAG